MQFVKAAVIAATIVSSAAFAETITVVTSFPKELTEAYKKAYEKKYPADKVEILNKGTPAGMAYVREQPAGSRAEIFWASAPDAFEVLAQEKLLAKVDVATGNIPAKVGDYPINDPDGFYRGQALAGYGLMWNTRYMQAHKLPVPKEWVDLTKPVYFGHVATSSPSRSSAANLTRTSRCGMPPRAPSSSTAGRMAAAGTRSAGRSRSAAPARGRSAC